MFYNNSITHAEDKCTAIAKGNTNNANHVAVDSAHAQCDQPTIGLAQRGAIPPTAWVLHSIEQLKKLNRNKHVNFAMQSKVHLYDNTATPSITLTYDSGADRHYIREQDQLKVGLPILHPST
jgi:hypothetical protein